MPRRPWQREAASPHGLDRRAGCEQSRLERRLAGDRVTVEPRRLGNRVNELDVVGGVTPFDVRDRGRRSLVPPAHGLDQYLDPAARLRVVARGMQACEVRMRQDVDAALAARRPAIAPMPQLSRSVDASANLPAASAASSEPCSRMTSAAFFGPTPGAPGIRSEGSPRRAMKSGTCAGSTP